MPQLPDQDQSLPEVLKRDLVVTLTEEEPEIKLSPLHHDSLICPYALYTLPFFNQRTKFVFVSTGQVMSSELCCSSFRVELLEVFLEYLAQPWYHSIICLFRCLLICSSDCHYVEVVYCGSAAPALLALFCPPLFDHQGCAHLYLILPATGSIATLVMHLWLRVTCS